MSETEFKGVDKAAKLFMTSVTSADKVISTRVTLVTDLYTANGVGTKGGASQNKTCEALSAAIALLADGTVSGFGIANLANYGIVGRAITRLGIAKVSDGFAAKLYSGLNSFRKDFDGMVEHALTKPVESREAAMVDQIMAAIKAKAETAEAGRIAAAEGRKDIAAKAAARIAAGLSEEDDEESATLTVQDILTAGLSAVSVAASVDGFAALPWSPEDAKTILAALNAAVDKLTVTAGLTAVQGVLVTK